MPTAGKAPRPLIITIFCVIGFIGVALSLFTLASPASWKLMSAQFGSFFIPSLVISLILGFTGLLGLWKMKKWGVYSYTGMAIFSTATSLYMKVPFNIGYIVPFVLAFIGFMYLKDMD